jgi:hypothetical protein
MTRAPEIDSEPETKRSKTDLVETETLENILTRFDFVKILNENALSKLLIIEAACKPEKQTDESKRKAVVIFEKSHFNLEEVKSYLEINNSMQMYIDNNEYKKLCIYPCKPFNSKLQ